MSPEDVFMSAYLLPVLRLLVTGASLVAIGQQLNLRPSTINRYCELIYDELGGGGRRGAMRFVAQYGMPEARKRPQRVR